MLTHRGFSAWITCDGQALPEYLVAVEEDVHQVSCWIPSEEGKPFIVYWRDNTEPAPAHPIDSCGFITLDGLVVPGRFLFGTGTACRGGVRSGPNTERPFVFLKVGEEEEAGDGDTPLSKSKQDVGTIIVRIRRVQRVDQHPANPIQPVSGKVLGKRKTGDVGIGFGEDVPAYYQSPATWKVKPHPEDAHAGSASYVTFVFRYRSAEFLQSQGIMPAPRAQPQSLTSGGVGSSHYRTKTASVPTTNKAKGKGKAREGGTGLETPAMTPLPFPMRSLPPPAPPALPTSPALPVFPALPLYPPHPMYPPHPESKVPPQQQQPQPQPESSSSSVAASAEASGSSAEASTAAAPNAGVYPPMTPTPSATPVDVTQGNTGPSAMAMRRIVSAPIVPTQLQLQEQRIQERLLHEHREEEESSATTTGAGGTASRSPPRKRPKQSDFLANGPYRMRRPSDMKRSMSWRAPNSKPSSSLSSATSSSSSSITSSTATSTSNATSLASTATPETIAFSNPFTNAPLIRSTSNPHPHPQLNPGAQPPPQSHSQSRSYASPYANDTTLGPTQLPQSQPQLQTLAEAARARSQPQTLAQSQAQRRQLPYRRPSINTTRALQQKREQQQQQQRGRYGYGSEGQQGQRQLPPPPSSSSPFSSSPETPVAEEFGGAGGSGGEALVSASPVFGGGVGSGAGSGGGGSVVTKRREIQRGAYEDVGDIGLGLGDGGGETIMRSRNQTSGFKDKNAYPYNSTKPQPITDLIANPKIQNEKTKSQTIVATHRATKIQMLSQTLFCNRFPAIYLKNNKMFDMYIYAFLPSPSFHFLRFVYSLSTTPLLRRYITPRSDIKKSRPSISIVYLFRFV
ncbi:hypothetical protein EYR38_004218 [Pleurotus pulmonarius]|nr:hypothetical protein EYR38_004218 [Pleurotus pulmonarius]